MQYLSSARNSKMSSLLFNPTIGFIAGITLFAPSTISHASFLAVTVLEPRIRSQLIVPTTMFSWQHSINLLILQRR